MTLGHQASANCRSGGAGWRALVLAVAMSMLAVASAGHELDIDAPPGHRVSAAYFGAHIHNLMLRGRVQDPPQVTPWPDGLIGSLRLWDSVVRWGELEPEPTRWNFGRMDLYVAQAEEHGATVLYTLGSTPRWASARPDEPCSYGFGCAAPPRDWALWDRYVTAVARRYKGRIGYYELWNEPHPGETYPESGFFTGTVGDLVEMARRARLILAREDPQARLLTPGFVHIDRVRLLDQFLASGGAAQVQGLSYHFYSVGERQMVRLFKRLEALRERHGLTELAFFNTESGVEGGNRPPGAEGPSKSVTQAAEQSAGFWVLGAVMGLGRWYHHGWDSEETGMVTRELARTPSWGAWQRVRDWLVGARPQQCRWLPDDVLRCSFLVDGQRLWVLWAGQERSASTGFTLPSDWVVTRAEAAVAGPLTSLPQPGSQILLTADPVALWVDEPVRQP